MCNHFREVFCMNNALFLLFYRQRRRCKLCLQFLFFQIIRQNAVNDGFRYLVLSTIILQLARRSSFKTAATRVMFCSFLLFLSFLSTLRLQLTFHWLQTSYTIEIPHESPNAFTNISRVLRICKSRFTTKFYHGMLFKIFFHGNL